MPATWPGQPQEQVVTSVSLLPQKLDLDLYCGDGIRLRLHVRDTTGAPIPLSGLLTAQIRVSRKDPTVKVPFEAEITDAQAGEAVLTLTGEDTSSLHGDGSGGLIEKFSGVWDVQWSPEDNEPVTLFQGSVESVLDVTRD